MLSVFLSRIPCKITKLKKLLQALIVVYLGLVTCMHYFTLKTIIIFETSISSDNKNTKMIQEHSSIEIKATYKSNCLLPVLFYDICNNEKQSITISHGWKTQKILLIKNTFSQNIEKM